MTDLVSYTLDDAIATIAMDDGKVNALSPQMLKAINDALDRALADEAIVVLTGRPGVFCAGFDLRVLQEASREAIAMVRAGFELAVRLLSFPKPVVIACNGHAVAMGAFLLLSGDHRVGAAGPYKITANEVAIGITIPHSAIEICRQRLTPAHFSRATVLAEVYAPDAAVAAGFLDRAVAEADLAATAREVAEQLRALDLDAHAATKLRVRDNALAALRAAIELDEAAPIAPTVA
ncbi:MAG: crotonase/enoyl-CoA hydratase family protein [Micromonosporaceae bacterium]